MNLGELIVDLSLDYAEFNQSLEQAKKAASNAAASIEKSFDKISLTIEVDDSALYDLNKHLDLKYRHFKEVNNYFKNNPLTPTVDDGELTDLNKTLKSLTQNKHTVTIEQRINAKLTDSSKRDISDSVTEGVADGVEKGVSKGLHDMDKMIAKAVSDGIRAGSKSFNSTSKPSGKGKGESIEDVVSELKKGFGDLQKQVGNSLLGDAVKTVLKPARDFITGFSEGISNDLGKQISKGLQQTFAKQLGMDFQKMGEQAGNKMLGAFGIKVKKENKLLTAIGDGSQIAVKSLSKSVERYAVRKLNKALTDSLDNIFTELLGTKEVEAAAQQKAQTQAKKAKVKNRTLPSYVVNNAPFVAQPIPDPWGYAQIPDPWEDVVKKPKVAPVNIPNVVKNATPVNIPNVVKNATPLNIPKVAKQQKELEKVLVENSLTPLEIAARDSNKNFGYVLNEIGKFKVKGSPVGGGNQTVRRVATEIIKIKTSHQKAYQAFKNLLDSAQELGNYELVDQLYAEFTQNSLTAKKRIDELLKEGTAAGLKQKGFNKLSGKKAPITSAADNIKSQYFSIGRQAEKEAGDIGSNVISGLGIGLGNKAFAKFGRANAYAYLLAIKDAFEIKSPSRVMIGIGLNIIQGLILGVQQQLPRLSQLISNIKFQFDKGLAFAYLNLPSSVRNNLDHLKFNYQVRQPAIQSNLNTGRNILLDALNSVKQSLIDTKKQGATLGQFFSNALKAGSGSILGNLGVGSLNAGSIINALKSGQITSLLPTLLPLLTPILGLKGLNLGDTIVSILNKNLAIKPGFLNDLFKSLTGIKLEKTGLLGTITNTLGISKGSQSRINTPLEVIRNQAAQNLSSVGTGGSIPKLVENTGQMLVSAVLKQFGVSGVLDMVIKQAIKNPIANFANLGIFSDTSRKGIGGRVRGIADAYSQDDVDGVIKRSTNLAGTLLRTIGFRVDMKQLTLVMGTAVAGITAFHKAFSEEGLGLGKALVKGFTEAKKNWANAFDDLKRKAKDSIGKGSFGDIWNDIWKRMGRGFVVPREMFDEAFTKLGSAFKNGFLKNVTDKDGMQGNILSFVASIATMFAPIATFATALMPLLIPMLPVLGALGGLALMVGKHLTSLGNAIKKVEPLQRRLNFLGGSPEGGEREMNYARGVASRLNVPVEEGINAYSQLAIAARGTKLEGDGVKELYEGISASLSALGISGHDASLVFMAYTQMLAKGKISMEELRQQLGEKFPPAMGNFAKALGVSTAELTALASKGALLSEDVLLKVTKVLQQDYGNAAANSAGSFTIALTKLGNVGFDIAIKLTKSFGGVFAMFTNLAANGLGMLRDALDVLIPLANSVMIGVTAVVGVGLTTLLQLNPVATFLANVNGLLASGISALMGALAPYYLGIVADVADGWLGAQQDLISNMTNGVSNVFVAIFGFLDTQTRLLSDIGKGMFGEMVGELDAIRGMGELIGIVFEKITTPVVAFFQSIPSGLVEIGAMVLMFRQVQVLAQGFLNPNLMGAFKGLTQIAGNFGGMIQNAFTKNSIKDLFGGTFGAIDIANTFSPPSAQPSMGSQIKQEIGELLGAGWNKLTQSLESAKNFISKISWQGFTSGLSRAKNTVVSAISPFTSLFSRDSAIRTAARDNVINSISNAWQGFTNRLQSATSAVASALIPFTALFSSNSAIRSAARADWANAIAIGFGKIRMALAALKPLLFDIGIALALFMLSRSDFSNPIQGSINKMARSMNDALKSIDKSFASLGDGLDKTTGKIQNLVSNLPSKGLELNIKYAVGMGGESFKTDDLIKELNQQKLLEDKALKSDNVSLDNKLAIRIKRFDLNAFSLLTRMVTSIGAPDPKKAAKQAQELGIGDQITGNEARLTAGQEQLLGQFKSLKGNSEAMAKELASRGLTRATVGNLMQGDTLKTVKQVRQVEKELYELGKKRAELARQNTSESRNKISELDKQLFALQDKRAKLVKPLLAVDEDVKSFQKSVEDMSKAIEESDNPPDVKRKLRAMLEPMQEMAKEASQIVNENLPVKPLEDVYQNTINALKDFELAYERFGRDLEKASLARQEALFTSGATPGQVQFGTRAEQINTDTSRLNALKESVRITDKSLKNLEAIPGIQRTEERANEIKELRKKLQEGELGVQQLSTSITRNRYELQQELVRQTKQVADYYRGAVREAEFVSLEFEKASRNLKNTQLQTKLKQALIGAGDNLYTQFIENIINIIQQTSTDIENARTESQRQQLEYRNNIEDIQLQASELARSLPGEIIPFDQSVVIDFDNALKDIDGTVNTINSSIDKVENNLGVDIVEAAKKANDALQSIDRRIAEIESSSKQWTNTLTSGFTSFIDNFKNGWQGVGQAIADVTGQSTNLIATLLSGAGIVGAIASGVQAANEGQFGSGVQQGVQQFAQNPIGFLKNKVEEIMNTSIVSKSASRDTTGNLGKVAFVENSRSSADYAGGHIGDDIFAPIGSKIFAPASGMVVQSRVGGTRNTDDANPLVPGYQPQQLVIIKLDMPIEFAGKKITHLNMRHLLDRNVEVGQKVNIGDLIGTVGEAGGRGTQFGTKNPGTPKDADAAHLHIEYAPSENNQRNSLPDFQASKLTAKLSEIYTAAVQNSKNNATNIQTRQYKAVPQAPVMPGGVLWGQAANYAPSNLSGLTARGKKAMAALQNPNVRAFLDAIAVAEVGVKGAAQGGYGYLIGDDVRGRESFNPNDLNTHPGKRIRYGKGKNEVSSATGRYQTMDFVWKEEAGRLGLKDFKPQSQEILAVSRLMYRGILDEIMAGDFKSVIKRSGYMDASSEWVSLQGNPHGQGSPTGKLNVFFGEIQRNLQNLNSTVIGGRAITPKQMQQVVAPGRGIKLNTAAQQFQINQANSGTSQANLALKDVSRDLEISKAIASQRNTNFNEAKRLAESSLNFDQELFNSLNPNQSDRQKFIQELQKRKLKLEIDIAEQQRIIDSTSPTIAKGIDLQSVFNEAKASYLRSGSNESRAKELAQQLTVEAEKTFTLTKQANDNAVKQKAALEAQRDNIIKTMQSDFNTKEQLRIDEQNLRITEDQIQLLQKELDLVKQLEQFDPLNSAVKTIPEIEYNLANLNLQKETISNLIQLEREFITGGGSLPEDVYKKRRDAILKANESQQKLNRGTFDYNKLIKELDDESKQLSKTQLLLSSQMKSLQLENESFAIKNRIGLVNVIGLTNELTIKVNELTNAYKQQNIETRNPSNGLTEQERLTKRLRDFKNFQKEEQNIRIQFNADKNIAEQVTNRKALLDLSSRRFNLINQGGFDARSATIEGLRNSNANEFMVNKIIRDLETQKENERHRIAKEQLRIDVNQFNLDMEAMGFHDLMLTTEQIEKMSAALDELNQKKLDDITRSAQTFEMALKKVFQEGLINGLTTGITDLINGTKSLGETLNDLANNILNGVLNLALNSLFKSAFGGGGFLGGIFGFNKGGKVPNYAEGGVIGAIGDALQRERQASGVKPVLAALTPGERVLTVQQNKRFEELQMEKVLNYSQGGVVGNVPRISVSAPSQSSNINISVPVNVQGGQNDASVNVPQLQNAVRSAVLTEIQKQQRPGGALNK